MLKYIGDGFLVGVPARDLTDEEVKLHGGVVALVKTGLYAKVEESAEKPAKKQAKKDGE